MQKLRIKFSKFIYKNFLKKIFFLFDPEFVHDRILLTGKILGKFKFTKFLTRKYFSYNNPVLEQNIAGIYFSNPVGLSAGFDKNANILSILPEVGFAHAEIGSVTLLPYAGNPKPRLYRLKKSKALVVYYGLKNEGVEIISRRIKQTKNINKKFVMGISIAKTNCDLTASEEGGVNDYYESLKYLEKEGIGQYYTINISCPNTFGGEPFTTADKLDRLMKKISELAIKKPIFIKMPINLPLNEFDELLKICIKYKVTGVVIGNLTKDRNSDLIKDIIPENIKGGISGKPTFALSNSLISYTYKNYKDKLIIIGVGGIFSAEDAYEKIKRGANLLQLITGMIFEGPQLISEINIGLVELLKRDGFKNISDAVGTYDSSVQT